MGISWRAWLRAFREASPHSPAWVNVRTGEVKRFKPRKLAPEELEALEGSLYEDEDWVEVPYAESDDEFKDMQAFAMSAEAGGAGLRLLASLGGEKPFRAFRKLLGEDPAVAAAWHANRIGEAEARLWSFCKAYGIVLDHPQFARFSEEDEKER